MTLRRDPGLRVRAAVAIVIAIPVLVVVAWLADPGAVVLVWAYMITGFLLVVRRPRQPVAWMLILAAAGLALGSMHVAATVEDLEAGTADAVGAFTAWANGVGWNLVFAGFTGIGLLFPTGSMPRGRWGVVAYAVVIAFVPVALANTFGPSISINLSGYAGPVSIPNPAGWAPGAGDEASSLFAVLFVLTVVAQVSLLARFRVSTGVERLQYRWLVYALLLVVVATFFWAFVVLVLHVDSPLVANIVVLFSYPAVPVAVVIAVLRYRLYDIDRLVSRSLGWGLATAAVVGVFAVVVLALQAALTGITQGGTVAVAASTLLAAAAFQPIRSRVQAVVDRRFDRPRLEAERSLAAYGERLQHEVDLATLASEVEETVVRTLRPSSAGLWIRGS
jgi:hypothetical protein